MIGVNDNRKNTEAFHQVAKYITRYIHFGGYDVISEIVDSSYIPVEKIKKFFNENEELIPDNPFDKKNSHTDGLYRVNKLNDLTYNVEYDFVRGDNIAYMTLLMQFVYDQVEPYITVEIQDIRRNN